MEVTGVQAAAPELFEGSFLRDPFPTYAALRERGVAWMPRQHAWVAAGHRSVLELSRSRLLVRAPAGPDGGDDSRRTLQRVDGREHARLRSAVADVFRGPAIGRLEAWVGQVADDLVGACRARGEAELMSQLAHPLSMRVVARILGLPEADLEPLAEWTGAIAAAMGPTPSPAARAGAAVAGEAVAGHIARIAAARRSRPREDLVTRLVADPRLSAGEAEAMIRLLLFTGSHPMALTLGNALLTLARSPEQLDAAAPHPPLPGRAVEECLRFDPVIQATSRRATATIALPGCEILEGETVILLYGSANRDERVFPRADEVDLGRHPNPHLTFGRGAHACLAPLLARLELRAVLEALLRRRIRIRPASEPIRLVNPVLRGLDRLPAHLEERR